MNFIPSNGWPQLKDIPEKLEHFREVYARFAKVNRWYQSIEETELTGNPVIFEKALKLNATALSLNMLPIQSGSGDPSPENVRPISGRTEVNLGRTGKNLLPMTVAGIKAANTSGTWSGNTYTRLGVSYEVQTDADGNVTGIKATGTATNNTSISLNMTLKAGTYTVNGSPANGSGTTYRITVTTTSYSLLANDTGSGATFTLSEPTEVILFCDVRNNYAIPSGGIMYYPMIRDAAETDPTFEPYTPVTLTIALGSTVYGGSLDVKTGSGSSDLGFAEFDGSDDEVWGMSSGSNYYQFQITISDAKDMVNFVTNEFKRMDIYYRGQQTGAIYYSDKMLRVALLPDMNITTVAEWRAWLAQNPLQVAYELATPTTIQLTGAELALLMGYNYISTDADSLTVKAYTI